MGKSLLTLSITIILMGLWILPAAADSACTPTNTSVVLESEPNHVLADAAAFVDIPAPSPGRCIVIYGSITAPTANGADFDAYRLTRPQPTYFLSSNHDPNNNLTLTINAPTLGMFINHNCMPLREVCSVALQSVTNSVVDFIISATNPGFYTLTIRR